ncbi:MAG: xanthine dehydrogenase family protein subunit M, partial [Mucilaginibacter polytrichastri]|nr:xanthine dehydrogenase family protein subunit M [Mucilaginibacter polytrichastri]
LSLKDIKKEGNATRIGALVRNTTVAENDQIVKHQPLLSMAINAGASAQIRNMATVGGNLLQRTRCAYFYDTAMRCNKREPVSGCDALEGYNRMHAIFGASDKCIAVHPSDMAVALRALDATVIVSGPKGERSIPMADFHRLPGDNPEKDTTLAPNELITAILIPGNPYNKNAYYLKVRDRNSYAFALVSVAAALDMNGTTIRSARLAMGGVAHKPWRLPEAEAYLAGKTASEDTFKAAAGIAMKGAKAYEYNAFKLKMAPNCIFQALSVASGIKQV